ncbi:ABC transporter ATP-binding protein, partial [Bifidobacterium adolescentis]
VTHSQILLGLPDADILSFDENGVHPCDYEDTDSYQITRVFINHRESLLRHLLGNET